MTKQKQYLTCDGNQAAAHIAYMFSEVAAIYPITPSSTMAEYVDEWAAQGRKNIFGQTVMVQEMQSEAGAAGVMHGSLQAGALTTTFTASQGLLLMIPNMYKMAGELLPGVFHVAARALASHALSIFGDHQDVMAARSTGFAMFATGSVQEVMDLAAVAHLASLESRIPFVHFFDGFRTSHEIQKVEALEMEDLAPLLNQEALEAFRQRALSPDAPVTRGTAQNDDIYFQAREASNPFYEAVPGIVEKYLDKLAEITGRKYGLFDYYGHPEADRVIIAMGSVTQTIKEVVDYLNTVDKRQVGVVCVHLYRPFKADALLSVIPKTAKRIAVLDRTKEPGAEGQPLYLDVKSAFYGKENAPEIVGGIYGLSSKDTTPAQILAVYKNLKMEMPKNDFTIGIVDDVTFKSLPLKEEIPMDLSVFEAKFYGLGSDGTVGANKNSIKIIGDNTSKYVQAYFAYDSKKSGGFTCSHLRFSDTPIRSTYLNTTPNLVACHVPAYLHLYDVTKGLRKGGAFLLNSLWSKEEVSNHLPDHVKKYFADNDIKLYIINATMIASEIGLGNRTNTILQSAFFKISNVIPYELAVEQMKKFIVKSYGKKGEEIVNKNFAAVDRGSEVEEVEVLKEWSNINVAPVASDDAPEFIQKIVRPISQQRGYDLPVSAFVGREDGTWDQGTTKYERRGVAVFVPEWNADNCIQCNQCAYVCPHATIRPFVLNEEERKGVGEIDILKAQGKQFDGMGFRIQVNVLECLGCGNCADVCPGKKGEKALTMKAITTQYENQDNWDYMVKNVKSKQHLVDTKLNVKNSQFATPLFEFSGACSGCGETPYIKLITQLYGDRMMIANATGCSSIYGASAPASPYTTNEEGKGPSWANSLFEDNAEFGFGFVIAQATMRNRIQNLMEQARQSTDFSDEEKSIFQEWIDNKHNGDKSKEITSRLLPLLRNNKSELAVEILSLEKYLTKKSIWIFGGDGWAYDIGFGGLDHVLAMGQDVNVLVLDTEVYSNTGGQSSKSTPIAAVAKFAAAGKRIRKKDLGMIASTYGYVYVAQVSMGANQAHFLKVLKEAEEYNGPSLIIAYSPCISHGLKKGMGSAQAEEKAAVECGYWHLWRYNPQLENEGKNPFILDSKEPDWSKFRGFLGGEVRYTSLSKSFPSEAEELYQAAMENAQWRYKGYQRLANMEYGFPPLSSEDVTETADVEK